jgi:hypothetical protein
VQYRVGIGIAQQTTVGRNLDTAENELSAAAKAMHIKTMATAQIHRHLFLE